MMQLLRTVLQGLACLVLLSAAPAGAQTLRMVAHSDLKVLDPIWTTAFITRNHGYLVYDTLFAKDEELRIRPQMVDKYETSADKLTWTFTQSTPGPSLSCSRSHSASSSRRWASPPRPCRS